MAAGCSATLRRFWRTVERLRGALPPETTLLGFCGAPWTVGDLHDSLVMGTPDQAPARLFAYREPEAFEALLDLLADLSAEYLSAQIDAGADAVQIFDSWAGCARRSGEFERFSVQAGAQDHRAGARTSSASAHHCLCEVAPARCWKAIAKRRARLPSVSNWTVPLSFARTLQADGPVQGNLDPMRVVAGGEALDAGVDSILEGLGGGPLIFNLGHGITPQADPDQVTRLVERIRQAGTKK